MSSEILHCAIGIIKAYLAQSQYNKSLTDEQLKQALLLLQKHDVAHLSGLVLSEKAQDAAWQELFFRFQYMATLRYEKRKYAMEQLHRQFEENQIPFMPLKGAVIADYYQEPWHRTSCDVDILVPEKKLEQAQQLLQQELGYRYAGRTSHDVSLFSPNEVHLELHYAFYEDSMPGDDVWSIATRKAGSEFCYELPAELFILHQLAHMAKHLKSGGCGFRPFIDLWILLHNMPHDRQKLDAMLKEQGLQKFTNVIFDLAELWFGDGASTDLLERLGAYILDAGAYGSMKNKATVEQIKKKSKLRHVLSRIFLPYQTMKYPYPVLEKHPWLLPFCQLHRWVRLLRPGNVKNVYRELSIYSAIDEEQKNKVADLLQELELL